MDVSEITPESLRVVCPECKGTKQLGGSPFGTIPVSITSYGLAGRNTYESGPCRKCSGQGFLLTKLGRTIMEFVHDHKIKDLASMNLRPMADE